MTGRPRAARRCPLCGAANHCAPARSGRFEVDCWCRDLVFERHGLARLSEEQRGQACLCQGCANGARMGAPESTEPS